MRNKHAYFFVGTTAEFIKLTPIVREFKKRKIPFKIITSGQTRIFFEEFEDYLGDINADIALKEKKQISSIFYFALWAINTLLEGITKLKKEFRGLNKSNSFFIIHGDTASSFLGSLIAKFYGLKIVHIESGLRSYNILEPFPEEILRYLNMKLADVLFCPNGWAKNNIKNFKAEKIVTGENTLIETYWWASKNGEKINNKKFGKYYILYLRRQEHVYFKREWTKNIIRYVIKQTSKNLKCAFTLNFLSERFLKTVQSALKGNISRRLIIVPRIPYVEFMKLMKNAEFIATDGCTNQEDAYYMGLPLLALRNRTERIEGLGENVVISKGNKKIIKEFLKNYKSYRRKPIFTRKRPSKIIVDYLERTSRD